MIYVALPTHDKHRLSFYLAMEEFLARERNDGDDLFFTWQVEPSVIFGRHQVVEQEVNLDYCRSHGIACYRRKSGGGCVYADQSNVMLSYITRSDQVVDTFDHYLQMVTGMLNALGVATTTTAHNDILIAGRKVSGAAYYHIPGHSIVHSTMLFDTDMQHMLSAITPPATKMERHGVQSVRQRITLLREHADISIDAFMAYARHRLCDSLLTLTADDMASISRLECEYLDPAFIFNSSHNSID